MYRVSTITIYLYNIQKYSIRFAYMPYLESVNHSKCEINNRCMNKLNIYPRNPHNPYNPQSHNYY